MIRGCGRRVCGQSEKPMDQAASTNQVSLLKGVSLTASRIVPIASGPFTLNPFHVEITVTRINTTNRFTA